MDKKTARFNKEVTSILLDDPPNGSLTRCFRVFGAYEKVFGKRECKGDPVLVSNLITLIGTIMGVENLPVSLKIGSGNKVVDAMFSLALVKAAELGKKPPETKTAPSAEYTDQPTGDESDRVLRSRPGDKLVFFQPNAGYDCERKIAQETLVKGQTYIIARIRVGGWESDIWLAEHPNRKYNSCHFITEADYKLRKAAKAANRKGRDRQVNLDGSLAKNARRG